MIYLSSFNFFSIYYTVNPYFRFNPSHLVLISDYLKCTLCCQTLNIGSISLCNLSSDILPELYLILMQSLIPQGIFTDIGFDCSSRCVVYVYISLLTQDTQSFLNSIFVFGEKRPILVVADLLTQTVQQDLRCLIALETLGRVAK